MESLRRLWHVKAGGVGLGIKVEAKAQRNQSPKTGLPFLRLILWHPAERTIALSRQVSASDGDIRG